MYGHQIGKYCKIVYVVRDILSRVAQHVLWFYLIFLLYGTRNLLFLDVLEN